MLTYLTKITVRRLMLMALERHQYNHLAPRLCYTTPGMLTVLHLRQEMSRAHAPVQSLVLHGHQPIL